MTREMSVLVGFAVMGLFYGLVLWVALRWARSRLLMRARLAAGSLTAVGARVLDVRPSPAYGRPAEVDFELDGRRARFDVRHYGRDWILCSVRVDCHPLPAVLVRAEGAADRMGKALGLAREVQLGDPAFDAAAFIVAAAPEEQVRGVLASPEVRRLVREVLALGYRVEMSRDGLRATRVQYALAPFDGAPVPAVMRALEGLVAALPRPDAATLTSPRVPSLVAPLLAALAFGMVAFGALLALVPLVPAPLDDSDSLRGLGLGLIPWAVVLGLAVRAMRGRTQSLAEVFLVALALLIGVPSLSALGLYAVNARLDDSAATTHRGRVMFRQRRDSEVYVTAWEPGRERQKVGVPRAIWRGLAVGDEIEVDVHPGVLGWPWVSGVRRVP